MGNILEEEKCNRGKEYSATTLKMKKMGNNDFPFSSERET